MKNMKKLLTGESLSSPAILCGDNQFHAALNMMARSRSPLPPSPTGSTPLLDSEICSIPSIKPLMPVPIELLPRNLKPPPPLKPKPAKPPRKNVPLIKMDDYNENNGEECRDKRTQVSDGFADYDDVEVRNDAWKTMGVNVMPHSERAFSLIPISPLEHQNCNAQSPEEHHYDRLQHLGHTSKLPSRSGYMHLNAIAPPLPTTPLPSPSETNDIEAIRSADDSHLGYGMIRKKSVPIEESYSQAHGPSHQVYNDLEYAIVFKPNRV